MTNRKFLAFSALLLLFSAIFAYGRLNSATTVSISSIESSTKIENIIVLAKPDLLCNEDHATGSGHPDFKTTGHPDVMVACHPDFKKIVSSN